MKHSPSIFLAIGILLAPLSHAEDNEKLDTKIKKLQDSLKRESERILLPEFQRYEAALAALEREFSTAGEFSKAATVQAERLAVRAKIHHATTPKARKSNGYTLEASAASAGENTLTWTPSSPLKPGGYKISTSPNGVNVTVSEGFHTAANEETLRISTGATITVTLPAGETITSLTLKPGA